MPPPVDQAQARWFAEQVQPHEPVLRSYLRGAFPAVRDVDDVVQESYARVWRAHAMAPIRSAKAFLFRVARNLALDAVRHERASPVEAVANLAAIGVVEERPDVAELLTREEKARLLGEALAELPARCREIVFQHKIKGLSQREVAERLGLSEKTVANQIALGVKRCEAYFQRRGIDSF